MKIIYEDGSDRNETQNLSSGKFDFEDISSESEKSGPKKPVRPVRRPAPTLRNTAGKTQENQSQAQTSAPVPQGQPLNGTAPYIPGAPQGFVPMQYMLTPEQTAMIAQQYPQSQPIYSPVQAMPQGYMTAQGYVPYQTQPPVQNQPSVTVGENNPGTRVLYQSPDFDRPERDRDKETVNYSGAISQVGIIQEDVDISDETVPTAQRQKMRPGQRRPAVKPVKKFDEDEVEMSVYELSAMNYKSQPTVKAVRQPGVKKSGLDEEEFEQEIEAFPEYEENENTEPAPEGKKKLPKSEIIRRIVLAVAIVAIIVSAAMLLNEWRLSRENKDFEDEISNLIIDVEPTTEPATEPKNPSANEGTTKPKETTTAPLTPAQQWDQIRREYPNVIFPADLQLKYAKLYAENQDFVGYLSADGVNLNLPIVQTDNDEEYMKKNFYGKSTKYGCPFVTHLNNIRELDMNTVIFGHHMNDGTVFGALDKYKSIEGFKKAPVITFNTLNKDYKWKIIAAFVTNAYEEQDNGYIFRYYFTSLSTQERYAAFLNELSQRSLYDTGVDVLPTDKILTLSTCSHEFTEARFVVVARLVRNGETAEVDVSKATVNPNPRYPQAYYDKKNKGVNPYKDASRWEVG